MKKLNLLFITAVLMAMSGCTAIGDIFKAGAITAIIGVVIVIVIIIWIVSLFRGKGN